MKLFCAHIHRRRSDRECQCGFVHAAAQTDRQLLTVTCWVSVQHFFDSPPFFSKLLKSSVVNLCPVCRLLFVTTGGGKVVTNSSSWRLSQHVSSMLSKPDTWFSALSQNALNYLLTSGCLLSKHSATLCCTTLFFYCFNHTDIESYSLKFNLLQMLLSNPDETWRHMWQSAFIGLKDHLNVLHLSSIFVVLASDSIRNESITI